MAEIEYKCTDFYDPPGEIRPRQDDPEIGLIWPTMQPLLSPKDEAASTLAALAAQLPTWRADHASVVLGRAA